MTGDCGGKCLMRRCSVISISPAPWNFRVYSLTKNGNHRLILLLAGDSLKLGLKRTERQVITGSNEWEQRLFMELVFLAALENHDIRM